MLISSALLALESGVEIGTDTSFSWQVVIAVGGLLVGYLLKTTESRVKAGGVLERLRDDASKNTLALGEHETRIDQLEREWREYRAERRGEAKAKAELERSSSSQVMHRDHSTTRKHTR